MIEDLDHSISAAWGRYRKVGDLDCLGSKSWRKRVGFTSGIYQQFIVWVEVIGYGSSLSEIILLALELFMIEISQKVIVVA